MLASLLRPNTRLTLKHTSMASETLLKRCMNLATIRENQRDFNKKTRKAIHWKSETKRPNLGWMV